MERGRKERRREIKKREKGDKRKNGEMKKREKVRDGEKQKWRDKKDKE